MNKKERINYCKDKVEQIQKLNVEIVKGHIEDIMSMADYGMDEMIENVDNIIENVKIFDIGNGLAGFEYKNERYSTLTLKELEIAINDYELWDKLQYELHQ